MPGNQVVYQPLFFFQSEVLIKLRAPIYIMNIRNVFGTKLWCLTQHWLVKAIIIE